MELVALHAQPEILLRSDPIRACAPPPRAAHTRSLPRRGDRLTGVGGSGGHARGSVPTSCVRHDGGVNTVGKGRPAGSEDIDVVRALFRAWRSGDAEAAERLIADDFVFTSPQDALIDRGEYFRRCFPTADRFVSHTMRQMVTTGDGDVFVLYEYELPDGARYRNCEVLTVRERRVTETQVFFGGRVHPA